MNFVNCTESDYRQHYQLKQAKMHLNTSPRIDYVTDTKHRARIIYQDLRIQKHQTLVSAAAGRLLSSIHIVQRGFRDEEAFS